MDDPNHSTSHCRFAGRLPAGSQQAVTVAKNGVRHIRRLPDGSEEEILSVGLACSECFSGPNLARILRPGFEYEMRAMEELANGGYASTLSIHTSSGVTSALQDFVDALERHLPWKNHQELDWCVSLQLEGASAVWGAIDMLLQVQSLENTEASSTSRRRTKVAVGGTSYHGPPSTSFGSRTPLWKKHHQLTYPVPQPVGEINEVKLFSDFVAFLDENEHDIGVMLFEPQWGSSQAALPWPKDLLKRYIKEAKRRGIKIVCDEIMCGLGRHGKGSLFISEAWDLDPDCVTFGKAIAGGVYPLSGAVLKKGQTLLHRNKCSVMQSHTYSGSSVRALMAATGVLNEIPLWLPSVAKLGQEMEHIFRYIMKISDGLLACHGQGLMWGGVFTKAGKAKDPRFRANLIEVFKKHCSNQGILPYHVPVGGFMVSPVMDIDVGTIYEIGERLEKVVKLTMDEVGWEGYDSDLDSVGSWDVAELAARIVCTDKCAPQLHKTRSCTSCTKFVCKDVRTRFLNV